MATRTAARRRMEWTGNPEADKLVASDPFAMLIGFCLDQQIPVEKAFLGPLDITQRLGTLDPRKLAAIDPAEFEAAFRQRPAIHRFPASMAARVQALCTHFATVYDNDVTRLWSGVKDAGELLRRLEKLPGFGKMKASITLAVLAKHLGVKPAGYEELIPDWPTLADVHTVAEREHYQAGKRAWKAAMRAQDTPHSAP